MDKFVFTVYIYYVKEIRIVAINRNRQANKQKINVICINISFNTIMCQKIKNEIHSGECEQ